MNSSAPIRRATTLDQWFGVASKFRTAESHQAGLDFQPRPTDILISPFPKSGTTWLQQITHGLRTRGSMDFEEITEVTPWIEMAYDMEWDLDADHVAEPRLFKSHLTWHDIPKGARYICSFRHPYDVVVSFYRFMEGWWFEADSISLDAFIKGTSLNNPENRGYWYHMASWLEQRENKNILLLCYEDMQADPLTTVRKIANFMGIKPDDALLELVVRQSSREFMLANQSHFDEHLIKAHFARRGGAPVDGNASKVTPGANNHERYQLSPALKVEFDAVWDRLIYQRFGFADYGALRAAIQNISA